MRIITNSGLSIFFGVVFLLAVVGQAISGQALISEQNVAHGLPPVSLFDYVTSSDYVVDVAENWQSEFLQFFLYIWATVWFVQKGSPESKQPGEEGIESDEQQHVAEHALDESPKWAKARGWRLVLYSNSLLLTMAAIFLGSWLAQSIAGQVVYSQEQVDHGEPAVTWTEYLGTADFWNRTTQNWQSEFLAVGCMVAFSIYLRQRGSPESKPVGTPHDETAVTG